MDVLGMPLVAATRALRQAVARKKLVNLTGPPGVGKSRLAADLPHATWVDLDAPDPFTLLARTLSDSAVRLLVVDGADGRGRRETLHRALRAAGGPVGRPAVVVISRIPLVADPSWGELDPETIALGPACDTRIGLRATALDPGARALVIRLAGGIPLLADVACRALESGACDSDPGAVADHVAAEVGDRLTRELPGRRWQHSLRQLATVGSGDEHLLRGGPDAFAALAALSIVRRTRLGLRLSEPYRALFELSFQWRKPQTHRGTRTRARAYRLAGMAATDDPGPRSHLAEQGLFLSGDPLLRRELFPARDSPVRIRGAEGGDAAAIGALMRQWAVHSGFDERRCDRLTERWAGDDIGAFRVATDPLGKVIGLACMLPVEQRTEGSLEPLLQQHSTAALQGGGLFLGAAHCPVPSARAHVLRSILRDGVRSGRLIVSTANPDYQALVRGLGFTVHGGIRDDFYRCGRPPEVSTHVFDADRLTGWLGLLAQEPSQRRSGPPRPGPPLAPKEKQVLLAYASGLTLKATARRAGITQNTAKDYLGRVKAKYRAAGRPASTKVELAQRVREDGLDRG
ncbi:hypothetical protein KME66_12190 [Streptomyces sp. YPW6]|uniref:hypothetical protein n=1 Tax=Streptomyces sp. YPW6 TaxID=2840373 RepID=UPI001C0E49A0|nr:hypothetical protein [Streptomyces sp. YPW6]QWQ41688.1 hypothetical protein KME66_12190 [Streptomyces sp. YPW6]